MKYEEWKREIDCSRCANILSQCSCGNKLLAENHIHKVFKLYKYRAYQEDNPNKRIIYALKEDNRIDVFDFLADELANAIKSSNLKCKRLIVTNVPRRPKGISTFGYDHAAELAKRVANRLDARYVSFLKSKSRKSQKESCNRQKNVRLVLKRGDWSFMKGSTVLIIDDIITTGNSIVAVSNHLKKLGVKKRIAGCIAIAYKDFYVKRTKSN